MATHVACTRTLRPVRAIGSGGVCVLAMPARVLLDVRSRIFRLPRMPRPRRCHAGRARVAAAAPTPGCDNRLPMADGRRRSVVICVPQCVAEHQVIVSTPKLFAVDWIQATECASNQVHVFSAISQVPPLAWSTVTRCMRPDAIMCRLSSSMYRHTSPGTSTHIYTHFAITTLQDKKNPQAASFA